MLIKKPEDIKSSEITDEKTYLNRRMFMRAAGLAGTTAATGLLYRRLNRATRETASGENIVSVAQPPIAEANRQGFTTDEKPTSLENITNYNNFYEFST